MRHIDYAKAASRRAAEGKETLRALKLLSR